MRERKEVREVNKAKELSDENVGVAAFFDLDGTLVALPSLERRFFQTLRYQRAISVKNYFFWLKEALRLVPRGINAILQANKMYLRGVQILDERGGEGWFSSSHKSGQPSRVTSKLGVNEGSQVRGQASTPPRRNPRLPVPVFFPQAIDRMAWHTKQGHTIVLLSGTLEPLARAAARDLQDELAARGIAVTIRFCATRLEESGGRFTGRILGPAMFGQAKARAAMRFAEKMGLDLARCYAYGDSTSDRWLMQAVGKPAAVNPSNDLADLARMRGWPVLNWTSKQTPTQRSTARKENSNKKEQLSMIA